MTGALYWVGTLVIAMAFGLALWLREPEETEGEDWNRSCLPLVAPNVLMGCLIVLTILCLWRLGAAETKQTMVPLLWKLALILSAYYALLLLLLPLLRRWVRPRAVAALWLLSNFAYLNFSRRGSAAARPLLTVRLGLSDSALGILLWVWAAGAAAVMAFYTVRHLVFRRRILKNARPVTDSAVLEVWESVCRRMEFKPKRWGVKLAISDAVTSPLTIGIFRWTQRLVLPTRSYTPEELSWIFCHELVHIRREDSHTKFFLTFTTALCWFNPLMWFAMRRCAEDLELGCDELVLRYSDEAQRQDYARLLLSEAGDDRGFSTCLSARAEALRYRLKNVVRPAGRRAGILPAMLLTVVLLGMNGVVSFAYGSTTGAEAIFNGCAPEAYSVDNAAVYEPTEVRGYPERVFCRCTDPAAVTAYLAALRLQYLAEPCLVPETEGQIGLTLCSGEGPLLFVTVQEELVEVCARRGSRFESRVFVPTAPLATEELRQWLTPEE